MRLYKVLSLIKKDTEIITKLLIFLQYMQNLNR